MKSGARRRSDAHSSRTTGQPQAVGGKAQGSKRPFRWPEGTRLLGALAATPYCEERRIEYNLGLGIYSQGRLPPSVHLRGPSVLCLSTAIQISPEFHTSGPCAKSRTRELKRAMQRAVRRHSIYRQKATEAKQRVVMRQLSQVYRRRW